MIDDRYRIGEFVYVAFNYAGDIVLSYENEDDCIVLNQADMRALNSVLAAHYRDIRKGLE